MLMSMRNEGTVTTSSVFIWGAGNYRIRLPALFCLSTGIGGRSALKVLATIVLTRTGHWLRSFHWGLLAINSYQFDHSTAEKSCWLLR